MSYLSGARNLSGDGLGFYSSTESNLRLNTDFSALKNYGVQQKIGRLTSFCPNTQQDNCFTTTRMESVDETRRFAPRGPMADKENQKRGNIGSETRSPLTQIELTPFEINLPPVSLADFMSPNWNRFGFRQKQVCPLSLLVNSAKFFSQQGTRTCPNQSARCPITSQTYRDNGIKKIMGTSVKPRDGSSSSTDNVVINSSSCEVNKNSGKQKDQQTTAKTTNHRDEQTDRLTVIQKKNVKQENLVSKLSSNFMCVAVYLDESQYDDDDQQMSRDRTEPEPPAHNLKWPWKIFKYIEGQPDSPHTC
ncbi:uncharacterized protein LOC129352772 [Poeciliopsis prolifica]|uniref:uncharacterized protein LOC129352772 n=1 Tax=Poeciliopsis prolifica TaxID=188132 RepID=UPI00241430A1|nr:uncharacterized protein LOC129352772 [Poeciliopsis prolifica]